MESLRHFFEPDRVALIGATEKFGFGYGHTKTLVDQGLGDRLFLINPSQPMILGKKTYPRISEVPSDVDLAVLLVPSAVVPSVLRECAAKGVKAAIIESAGFAEIGPEGEKIQEELRVIAQKTGLRIMGPNCVGLANTSNGFLTTATTKEAMKPGPIGIIAQSGVFGNIMMDCGPEQGVYFSKVVTLGNRCDVGESEIIRYLGHDEQTRVIALYLEGVQDGGRFQSAVGEVAPHKPIVVLKSGRSPAGKAATASHTGTLSGEEDIYSGAFLQSGVLRVENIQELFDLSKSLALQPIPRGSRVAILTTSGSLGAMTADMCTDLGLPLAQISNETIRAVSDGAPPWMNVKNPLDVGPSGLLVKALRALMRDPNVDSVIGIFLIPWTAVQAFENRGVEVDHLFHELSEFQQEGFDQKPFLFSVVGKRELRAAALRVLGGRIPIISSPENAARALASMVRYQQRYPQ